MIGIKGFQKGHQSYLTEEIKKKISNTLKGRIGKKHTEETKRKMSESKKGLPNFKLRGRTCSIETKKKMSESAKGRPKSVETRHRMSEARKGKSPWNKGKKFLAITGERNWRWKGGIGKDWAHYKRNRRNRELSAEGEHTLAEWELLKKQYGYKCPACGKKEPEIKLTEDHVIPLTKGGSDWIENIQPLCRKCNCKKYNKIIQKYDTK